MPGPDSEFASPIEFDPDGPGPAPPIRVFGFKWKPANAMVVKPQFYEQMDDPLVPLPDIEFSIYYQAALESFVLESGELQAVPDDFEITVVAGFSQKGWRSVSKDDISIHHTSHSGLLVNYFEIYFDKSRNANSLEGTGYNDGKVIFSGDVFASGVFRMPRVGPDTWPELADLDQFGPNAFPGVGTAVGAGRGNLESNPQSMDRDFFISPISRLYFRSHLETPFTRTKPSKLFVTSPGGRPPDLPPNRQGRSDRYRGGVNGMGDLQFSPMGFNTFAVDK
jgi:hypothetical protein